MSSRYPGEDPNQTYQYPPRRGDRDQADPADRWEDEESEPQPWEDRQPAFHPAEPEEPQPAFYPADPDQPQPSFHPAGE